MTDRSSRPLLPKAPVDLVAVAMDDCEVILAWTECRTAGGLGFRIERADSFGSACLFSAIGRVGPHVSAYRDGSVKPRSTYSYRVLAWNSTGDSPPSKVAEVTMPRTGTEQPADKE